MGYQAERITPPNGRILTAIGAGIAVLSGLEMLLTYGLLRAINLPSGSTAGAIFVLLAGLGAWGVIQPKRGMLVGGLTIALGLVAIGTVNLGGFLVGTIGCLIAGVVDIAGGFAAKAGAAASRMTGGRSY